MVVVAARSEVGRTEKRVEWESRAPKGFLAGAFVWRLQVLGHSGT